MLLAPRVVAIGWLSLSMEEHNSSLTPQESAAALSASALRELQHRAQTALAASRDQAARLEAEINQQLDAIAATLGEQIALDSQSSVEADAFLAEVARLTGELEHSRAAWQAERADLEAQRNTLSQSLSDTEAEREKLTKKLGSAEEARTELTEKLTELEIEREILAQKVAKLAAQSDDINPQLSSLETEKDVLSKKVADLEGQQKGLADKLEAAETKRDELFQQLTDLERQREELYLKVSKLEALSDDVSPKVVSLEAQRDELSQKLSGLETENVKFSGKIATLETERGELSEKIVGLESQRDEFAKKVARLETERDDLTQIASNYEAQRDELTNKVTSLESERGELTQTAAALEAQIHSSQTEWRNQLLDFENRLREQQGSWTEQRLEWTQARAGLERERDELQQKFDLALQDLQRLRARLAEVEQDLARRPESNQADSAELVALRAERDTLAARVEELGQQPATQIDANVEQQLSDLQRRFELAVEDLREYKTKSTKLEAQLAAASSQSRTPAADTGGNDWESQKRRLLASLEESAEAPETPVEKQQRITIEGTIEMTDAVVAEKDRQIAELQSKLAAGDSTFVDAEHTRKVNDLVEADDVIAVHRQRVRELEREMQEKLRAAELELSVERAKMARQRMELDELRSDLEAKKQEFESSGGAPVQGQPKRRWRDKLGLSGDE
jgi:chromosome segregation ATPase